MDSRVLLVDGDQQYASSLCRRLLSGGYQVTQLHHPRQALEAASLRDYDVAVLNCDLPEIDSVRLMSMLERRIAHLEVVILGDPNDGPCGRSQSGCTHVSKSRRWSDIESAIEAAVAQRRKRRADNRRELAHR